MDKKDTSRVIVLSRQTSAPPTAVWAVLTDIDRAAETVRGVQAVERLAGTGYQVGTKWRETRTMFGKTASEEMQVTEVEAGRRTVVEAESGGAHYSTVFELKATGHGTSITMEFGGRPVNPKKMQTLMWKIFGGIGLRAASKTMQKDLDDIARAAEQRRA